jgi:hypothetical protein
MFLKNTVNSMTKEFLRAEKVKEDKKRIQAENAWLKRMLIKSKKK